MTGLERAIASAFFAALAMSCPSCGRGSGGVAFALREATPPDGQSDFSRFRPLRVRFNRALMPLSATASDVLLSSGTHAIAGTISLSADARELTFTPLAPLAPDSSHRLWLSARLADARGHCLGAPIEIHFRTTSDVTPPALSFTPPDIQHELATNAAVLIEADEALASDALSHAQLSVRAQGRDLPIEARLEGSRWVALWPRGAWPIDEEMLVSAQNLIDRAGNPCAPSQALLHSGFEPDISAPEIAFALDNLPPLQAQRVSIPPSGFRLSLLAGAEEYLRPASLHLRASRPLRLGSKTVTSGSELGGWVRWNSSTGRLEFSRGASFPAGRLILEASVEDLAANASPTSRIELHVAPWSDPVQPFEQPQIIWADFESDRIPWGGGDGMPEWKDDLVRFGLRAPPDPIGANARLCQRCTNSTLEEARRILAAAGGQRLSLVALQPQRPPYTRICVGGLDPALPGRTLQAPSTGILGRTLFDLCNEERGDDACRLAPALGVFPGELFHAEARLALAAVNPAATSFGAIFAPLAPALGGFPAGTHPLDASVLASGFDPHRASPPERERYLQIETAIASLGLLSGRLLAHESAHTLGLVAPGEAPEGLFGDRSFHNPDPRPEDLMGAAVVFDDWIAPGVGLRPILRAYLGERIVMRRR